MATFAQLVDGKRVLVVDDDPSIRELLRSALADEGYEVVPATDGKDALRILAGWMPDVIVLDLMMPVMDGWTFAKRMRERYDIPIIALSAATELARHAKAIGACDMVAKPFDLDMLLPRVARCGGRPA